MGLLAAGFEAPVWSVAPYAALLLAIAVLPLTAPRFWHAARNQALVTALFTVPLAAWLLAQGPAARTELAHGLEEYFSFIVLLTALYTVAGGLVLRGDLHGGPL